MRSSWINAAAPLLAAGALSVGLLSCVPERDPEVVVGEGVAAAWIDAPVDGAHVALGTVEVVAHATAPGGVVEVVLTDGGIEVATAAADGGVLVDATFDWEPEVPGLHLLAVRGRDGEGALGPEGTATVHVDGEASVTTTTSPVDATTTTAPGTSTTATTVPASTTAPTTTAATGPTIVLPPPSPSPQPTPPPSPTPVPPPPTTAPACTPPTGLTPRGGVTTDFSVRRTWVYDEVCEAVAFRIETSSSASFPASRTTVDYADADHRDFSSLVACGTWYWRIAAIRSADTEELGPWSSTETFTVAGRGC